VHFDKNGLTWLFIKMDCIFWIAERIKFLQFAGEIQVTGDKVFNNRPPVPGSEA
jgi:hypothetical protein